ncbi:MAG: histidine kinase dimerization/phospho-acceptor domain-containing protein, partial [Thermodesulfobacteriota bacterium]|nr:histidine kinase dimerization/phospho-acceptor domain-containing protein [Thermodesulfobacteriota bacterium]
MSSSNQNIQSESKQFRLVKFFAWASFIVLLIFSFPFSMVISQKAKEILLRSYENYALLVGENLNHQVFQNFSIPVTIRFGKIKLREKEQYELMDRIVKNTIHGFNVDLVNIYDIGKGVIAYSTDPKRIGLVVKKGTGYQKAIRGKLSSGLISGDDFWVLGIERIGGKKKLRTYIPFRGMNPYTGEQNIFGVFELIQDMTEQYESIVKFQYLIFGLSILIMGLIFLALLLIVQKAEKVIRQRAMEQRELEEQLHQAERLATLGEMVAGVSHEIKNPLGIIQSTAELLGGMHGSDETQKRLSGVIIEESIRLNRVVMEFLDFAGPRVPYFQKCQLENILVKNLSFLSPELQRMGIQVSDNLNGRTFELQADQEQLYRAFLNILMNSIQSINDGGAITIRVDEEKGIYRIEIEDTGCGISQENLNKIFNPFFTT